MKMSELRPGMYKIMLDVKNPKADGRKSKRDFCSLPVWQKGTRVVVTGGLWEELRIRPPAGYAHLGVAGRRDGDGCNNHPGFAALVTALWPVDQTHREWVEVNVRCPDRVLVKLLETRKISRQDVLKAKNQKEGVR